MSEYRQVIEDASIPLDMTKMKMVCSKCTGVIDPHNPGHEECRYVDGSLDFEYVYGPNIKAYERESDTEKIIESALKIISSVVNSREKRNLKRHLKYLQKYMEKHLGD